MSLRPRWAVLVGTVVAVACGGHLSPSSTDGGPGEDAGGFEASAPLDAGLGNSGSVGSGASSSGPISSTSGSSGGSSSSGGAVGSSSSSSCTTPSGASSGIGPVEWACWKADDGGAGSDQQCVLDCCVKAHPMGGKAFINVAEACVCGSAGPCAKACANEFCADGTIATYGDECSTCLLQAVNGVCAQQIECQCGVIDCNMSFQCMKGCP